MLGLNGSKFDFFPILIKLIDAKDNLSLQVHPDNKYALRNEHEYGKTECWYILDCDENSELIYGFKKDISSEEFRSSIENNTVLDKVNRVKVKKGDFFFIDSGPLHIEKAVAVTKCEKPSRTCEPEKETEYFDGFDETLLTKCKLFTVTAYNLDGIINLSADESSFVSILVTDGNGKIENKNECLEIRKGDSVFIPASSGEITLNGKMSFIKTTV